MKTYRALLDEVANCFVPKPSLAFLTIDVGMGQSKVVASLPPLIAIAGDTNEQAMEFLLQEIVHLAVNRGMISLPLYLLREIQASVPPDSGKIQREIDALLDRDTSDCDPNRTLH